MEYITNILKLVWVLGMVDISDYMRYTNNNLLVRLKTDTNKYWYLKIIKKGVN